MKNIKSALFLLLLATATFASFNHSKREAGVRNAKNHPVNAVENIPSSFTSGNLNANNNFRQAVVLCDDIGIAGCVTTALPDGSNENKIGFAPALSYHNSRAIMNSLHLKAMMESN